jgi:hypothetical protein
MLFVGKRLRKTGWQDATVSVVATEEDTGTNDSRRVTPLLYSRPIYADLREELVEVSKSARLSCTRLIQ